MGNLHSRGSKAKQEANADSANIQKWTGLNINNLFFDEDSLLTFFYREYNNSSKLSTEQKAEIEKLLIHPEHVATSDSKTEPSDVELVAGLHSSISLSPEHLLSSAQQRLLMKHLNDNVAGLANMKTDGSSLDEAFEKSLDMKLKILQNLNVIIQDVAGKAKPKKDEEASTGKVPEPVDDRYPLFAQVSFQAFFSFILELLKSVSQIDPRLAGNVINSLSTLLANNPLLSLMDSSIDHVRPVNPTINKGLQSVTTWLLELAGTSTDPETQGKIVSTLLQLAFATGSLSDVLSVVEILLDPTKKATFEQAKPQLLASLNKFLEYDEDRPIKKIVAEPSFNNSYSISWPEAIADDSIETYTSAAGGDHVYILKGKTLVKVGTGINGTREGHIYSTKALEGCEYDSSVSSSKGCLSLIGDKLYYLANTTVQWPAESVSINTYKASSGELLEGQKLVVPFTTINYDYKPDPDNTSAINIALHMTTDGRKLYITSCIAEKDNTLNVTIVDPAAPQEPKHIRLVGRPADCKLANQSSLRSCFPLTNGCRLALRFSAYVDEATSTTTTMVVFSLPEGKLVDYDALSSPFEVDSLTYDAVNNLIWGYKNASCKLLKWFNVGVPAPRSDQQVITLNNGNKIPTLRDTDRRLLGKVFDGYTADTPLDSQYIALSTLSAVNRLAWYFGHSSQESETTEVAFYRPFSYELSTECVATVCRLAEKALSAISADSSLEDKAVAQNALLALFFLRILKSHICQYETAAKIVGTTVALSGATELPLKQAIQNLLLQIIHLGTPSDAELVPVYDALRNEAVESMKIAFPFLYPEPTDLLLKLISSSSKGESEEASKADAILLGIILTRLAYQPDLLSVFGIQNGRDAGNILKMLHEIVGTAVQSTGVDKLLVAKKEKETETEKEQTQTEDTEAGGDIIILDFLTNLQRQLFHSCYVLASAADANQETVANSTVVLVSIEYAKSLVNKAIDELSKVSKKDDIAGLNMTNLVRKTICALLFSCLNSICLLPKALLAIFGRSLLLPLAKLLSLVRVLQTRSGEVTAFEANVVMPLSKSFESIHPYENNMNETTKCHIEGAKQLVIHFDAQCATENNYDKLHVYKDEEKTNLVHGPISGRNFTTSGPLTVDGDTLYFHFTSDGSNVDWGWKARVEAEVKVNTTYLSSLKTLEKIVLWLSTRWVSGFFAVRSDSEAEDAASDKVTNYLDSEIFRGGLIPDEELAAVEAGSKAAKEVAFLESVIDSANENVLQFLQLMQMHIPPQIYNYNRAQPSVQRAQRAVFAAILKQSGLTDIGMDIAADLSTATADAHWRDLNAIWNASSKICTWVVTQTQGRLDEQLKLAHEELAALSEDARGDRELEIKNLLMASIAGDITEKAQFVIKNINADVTLTAGTAGPRITSDIVTPITQLGAGEPSSEPSSSSGPAFGRSKIANKWKSAASKVSKFTNFFSVYKNMRQKQVNRRNLARTLSSKVIQFVQDDAVTISAVKQRIVQRHIVAQHRLEEFNLVELLLESSTDAATRTNIMIAFYNALVNTNQQAKDVADQETETNILAKHYLVDLKAIDATIRNKLVGSCTHLLSRILSYLDMEGDSPEVLKLKLQALRCWCIEFTSADQDFVVQSGVLDNLVHIVNAPESAKINDVLRVAAWSVFRIIVLQILGLGASQRSAVTQDDAANTIRAIQQQQQAQQQQPSASDIPTAVKTIIDILFSQFKQAVEKAAVTPAVHARLYQLILLIFSIASSRVAGLIQKYMSQTKWVTSLFQLAFAGAPKAEDGTAVVNPSCYANSRILALRLLRVLLAQHKPEDLTAVVAALGYDVAKYPTIVDVVIEKTGSFAADETLQQATGVAAAGEDLESAISTELVLLLRALLPTWQSELGAKINDTLASLSNGSSADQLKQILSALGVLGGHFEKTNDLGSRVTWTQEVEDETAAAAADTPAPKTGVIVSVEPSEMHISEDGPLASNTVQIEKVSSNDALTIVERPNVDPTLVSLSSETLTALVNAFQVPSAVITTGPETAKLRFQARLVKALNNILLNKETAKQFYDRKLLPTLLKSLIQLSQATSSLPLFSESNIHKQLALVRLASTAMKKEQAETKGCVKALLASAPTRYLILGDDQDPESSIREQVTAVGASSPDSVRAGLVYVAFEQSKTSALNAADQPYEYEGETTATLVYQLDATNPSYIYYAKMNEGSKAIFFASEEYPNLSRITQYDSMTSESFEDFILTRDAKTIQPYEPVCMMTRKDNAVTQRFKLPIAARFVAVRLMNVNFTEEEAQGKTLIELFGWSDKLPTQVAERNVFVKLANRAKAVPLTLESTCIDGEQKNSLKKTLLTAKLVDWTALQDIETAREALDRPAIVLVDLANDAELTTSLWLNTIHAANSSIESSPVQAIILLADSMGKVNNVASADVPAGFSIPILGSAVKDASEVFYNGFMELLSLIGTPFEKEEEIAAASASTVEQQSSAGLVKEIAGLMLSNEKREAQETADIINDIIAKTEGNADESVFSAFASFYNSDTYVIPPSTLTFFTNSKWADMTTDAAATPAEGQGAPVVAPKIKLIAVEELSSKNEAELELLAVNLNKLLIAHLLTKLILSVLNDVAADSVELDREKFCTESEFVSLIKIALTMTSANNSGAAKSSDSAANDKSNELVYSLLTRLLKNSNSKDALASLLVSNSLGRIVHASTHTSNASLAAGSEQAWWLLNLLIDVKAPVVFSAELINTIVFALSALSGPRKKPIISTLHRIMAVMPTVITAKPEDAKLIESVVRLAASINESLKTKLASPPFSQSLIAYIELFLATRRVIDLWLTADEHSTVSADIKRKSTEAATTAAATASTSASPNKDGMIPADLQLVPMQPEHSGDSKLRAGSWKIHSGYNFPSFKIDATVTKGKLYYEIKLISADYMQFGWATTKFKPNGPGGCGVGDTPDSWSYDGGRQVKFHSGSEHYGRRWANGQIVGCAIDVDTKEMKFSLDGDDMGVAFSAFDIDEGIFPVISMTRDNKIFVNIGQRPFKHMPDGYTPVIYYRYADPKAAAPNNTASTSSSGSAAAVSIAPALESLIKSDKVLQSFVARQRLPDWFVSTVEFSKAEDSLTDEAKEQLIANRKWDNDSWTSELDQVIVDFVNTRVAREGTGEIDNPTRLFSDETDILRFTNANFSRLDVRTRFLVLCALNKQVETINAVDFALAEPETLENPISLSLTQKFLALRPLIWKHWKDETFGKCLTETQKDNEKPTIYLSRMRAMRTCQKIEQEFENNGNTPNSIADAEDNSAWLDTMFGQIYRNLNTKASTAFRGTDRAWSVKFTGEGATDAGGPYRESVEMCAAELQSHYCYLPLFMPTPNAHNKIGVHRDKFIPRPTATTPTCFSMFTFVGKLMGMALRSKNLMNLNLAPIVWKMLVGQRITRTDLVEIDQLGMQTLDMLIDKDGNLNADNFQYAVTEMNFTANSSDYSIVEEVELKPNGKHVAVTYENRLEYVALAEKFKRTEFAKQVNAILKGLAEIIPVHALKAFTWKELEIKVCGTHEIDISLLKKYASYSSLSETDPHVVLMWRVLESFDHEERADFLRFVWGRSTLPVTASDWGSDRFKIQPHSKSSGQNADRYLPEAHTCFFTLDLPRYTNFEVMRAKLLYAQKFCTAIDTDFTATDALE